MNNALISPNELIYSYDGSLIGVRIAQVEQSPFEDVNSNDWYFQTETQSCQLIPTPPEPLQDDSEIVY